MNYRTRLRNIREDHDETQAAVGRLLSKSQQGYNHIENGRAELSIEDLTVLCRHYDLSADYITGLSDVPRSFEEKKPATDISVRCVSAYLALTAAKMPDKTAYVDPKRRITFEELRQETMHIAVTAAVVLLSIVSLLLLIIAGAGKKGIRGLGIAAGIALAMMFVGAIGQGIVPKAYFGLVERFSVFAAVGYDAVLGAYLFRGAYRRRSGAGTLQDAA